MLQGFACLHLPSTGTAGVYHSNVFLHGFEDQNQILKLVQQMFFKQNCIPSLTNSDSNSALTEHNACTVYQRDMKRLYLSLLIEMFVVPLLSFLIPIAA